MMQFHVRFFFLSISNVLDKIKSSNVKKKTIYGRRWCYEWYKWLDDSDDEAKDNLNEVNGDEENEEILPSEQNASEDEIDFDCDDSGSSQNRPIYRKQFTRKRLVHSIDSSLDESNFEPIVYVNRNRNFERFTCYLGLKTNKNTKTISWDSEFPSVTGRQRTCDTIHRPISCLYWIPKHQI